MPGHSFSAHGPPQAAGCPDPNLRAPSAPPAIPIIWHAARAPCPAPPSRQEPAGSSAGKQSVPNAHCIVSHPDALAKGTKRKPTPGRDGRAEDAAGPRRAPRLCAPSRRSSHAAHSRAVTLRMQAMALWIDPVARCTSAPQLDHSSPHSRRASRAAGAARSCPTPEPRHWLAPHEAPP